MEEKYSNNLFMEMASPSMNRSLSRILFYDDEKKESDIESNPPNNDPLNELNDSMLELGQIAILSSSRASLKYRKRSNSTVSRIRKESEKFLTPTTETDGNKTIDDDSPVEIEIENPNNCMATFIQIKGSLFGILSAFLFVASNVVMKRSIHMSPTDHSGMLYYLVFA